MKLKPQSDYLLCKRTNPDAEVKQQGIYIDLEKIPEYQIVEISQKIADQCEFKVGDIIVSNAVPTKAIVKDETFYLVNVENAVGKVST